MLSFTVTHSHTYTTPLINPQITQPIITTLVLIRNYLKHFPIRVYMLSWAGVCLNKPTGFIAGKKRQAHSYTHAWEHTHTHTHTHRHARISGSDCGNQAVSTSPSVRMRGMRTDKRKKEKEIKQQKTCSFSAAAIL